jgi:transposase-like protein
MKKTRFSEEQIVKILREVDKSPVSEVAKKHGVSDVTIYAWRKRFGRKPARVLGPSPARRLPRRSVTDMSLRTGGSSVPGLERARILRQCSSQAGTL